MIPLMTPLLNYSMVRLIIIIKNSKIIKILILKIIIISFIFIYLLGEEELRFIRAEDIDKVASVVAKGSTPKEDHTFGKIYFLSLFFSFFSSSLCFVLKFFFSVFFCLFLTFFINFY